ncbi:hypothetical protein HXX76_011926 [Chlamydomonas incerta]|uniref:Flavin-containing monooxygenase n=1 Tax=Chlamydomonas incerta TaxID=51695 RepID=A0A835STF0_CHLIN|nr:hypothetical protein HXX76_011926 [Chlamydomonas incerta]|eukprot:KAG2427939.1 hypothetical protein HXX76_011926 [Chlamydomonas incerta]
MGVECCVLEATDTIGGVWAANYAGFGLQVPWRLYQFADFPWPESLQPQDDFPTGAQVQAYILAYAQHFGLLRLVRFNCKLLRLRWHADRRQWEALYSNTQADKFYKVTADYVVMCNGIYSKPYIPEYQGVESYMGTQLHAKYFTDMSTVKGRRVVIVGAGKTALDCVSGLVSANTAASVTMLYRKSHWPVPRSLLGISIRRLVFNRAFASMLPCYYTAGRLERARAAVTKPLRHLFWKSLECLIATKYPATTDRLKPAVSLPMDLFYGGQILDDRLDQMLEGRGVNLMQGEIKTFVRNGVILLDNSFLPADVVLYCTGYEKAYDYFDGEMRSRLGLQKDGLYLYRNCIPPDVPHLAFIGSEVSTYNNVLSGGLQALWLAHVLTGRVTLPPPQAMREDIRAQQRWRREVMPVQRCRGSVLMVFMAHYHDQLVADMGHSPRRKGANVLAECFGVYSAADYKDLVEQSDVPLAQAVAEQWRTAAEQARMHGPPLTVASVAASVAGAEYLRRHTTDSGREARTAVGPGALLAVGSGRHSAAATQPAPLMRLQSQDAAAEAGSRPASAGGYPRQMHVLRRRHSAGHPAALIVSSSSGAAGGLHDTAGGAAGGLASAASQPLPHVAPGAAAGPEARRSSRKSVMLPHPPPLPEASEVLYWQGDPGAAEAEQHAPAHQQPHLEEPAQQHWQQQQQSQHPYPQQQPQKQHSRHTVSGATGGGGGAYTAAAFGGAAAADAGLPRQPRVARVHRHLSAPLTHSWASRGGGTTTTATASPPITVAMERGIVSTTADSSGVLSCSYVGPDGGPDGASVGWTDAAGGSMHGGGGGARTRTASGMLPPAAPHSPYSQSGTAPARYGDGELEACGIRVVAVVTEASGRGSGSEARSVTGPGSGGRRIAPMLVGGSEGDGALAQREACGGASPLQQQLAAGVLPSASSLVLSSPGGASSSGVAGSVVRQLARAFASMQQQMSAVPSGTSGTYTNPLAFEAEQQQQQLGDVTSAADMAAAFTSMAAAAAAAATAAAIAATTALNRQQSLACGPLCSACGGPGTPASQPPGNGEPALMRHGNSLASALAAAAVAEALRQSGGGAAAMQQPMQPPPASASVPRPLLESGFQEEQEEEEEPRSPFCSVQAGAKASGGRHGLPPSMTPAGGLTAAASELMMTAAAATAAAVPPPAGSRLSIA